MEQPFVVKEDIWVDKATGKQIREDEAVGGVVAVKIAAGERISNEDAEKYGLLVEEKAAAPADNKAVPAAPEDKAVRVRKKPAPRKK